MIAAISAARMGAEVTLLEGGDRIGRKILSTGNGKCNFTNKKMDNTCFRSNTSADISPFLNEFGVEDTLAFFASLQMLYKEKHGYFYPASEQASTVLDVLRFEIESHAAQIKVLTGFKARMLTYHKNGTVKVQCGTESFVFDRVILACGSKASPKTGSDGTGYQLLRSLKCDCHMEEVVPALVQLKCNGDFFKGIAGVRTDVRVSLYTVGRNGELEAFLAADSGELQLTDYGISGIPVFQISRFIKRELDRNNKPVVHINFMPDYNDRKLNGILTGFVGHNPSLEIKDALNGILNKKISPVILKQSGIKPSEICQNITASNIKTIVRNILDFKVTPVDTNGVDNAQVCAGGVDLAQINLDTMESRIVNKLYFAGEILDVDGKCGGYNLQWAFASGRLAGLSAVR